MSTDKLSLRNVKNILETDFTEKNLEKYKKCIKTGFDQFDKILNGGLRQGLNIIGAVPSIGKTTFALQLACNIAMNPNENERVPVLYFALEESASMLVAKAICRTKFEKDRKAYLSKENNDHLGNEEQAEQRYSNFFEILNSDNLSKWADIKKDVSSKGNLLEIYDKTVSAEEIVNIVKAYINNNADKKKPLVVVDYFQIMKDPDFNGAYTNSKQIADKNLEVFSELKEKEIPLLLISSLNRANYNKPIGLESFKESGDIEYSADLLLGLQFSVVHELSGKKKDNSIDDILEKSKFPREVEIIILKNRYGSCGKLVKFKFYAPFYYFEEADSPASKKGLIAPSNKIEDVTYADTENSIITESEAKKRAKVDNASLDRVKNNKYKDSYINNTMIANEIRKGEYFVNQYKECQVFGKGNEITTRYKIDSELTCFDCDVADAVYSIYRRNMSKRNQSFTVKDVLRELSGKCDQEPTFKDGSNGDIIFKSLKKLSKATITIECPTEAEKRNEETNGKNMKPIYEGNFLNIEFSNENNGKAARITFKRENRMPLFDYAEPTQQVIHFPNELLNTKKAFSNTIQNIMIKRYLIRRLEIIKKENNGYYGKRIRYITNSNGCLFSELSKSRDSYSSDEAWNKEKRDTHSVVKKIMKRLKEIGYLTDFEEADDKNGIDITGKIIKDPFELPNLKR